MRLRVRDFLLREGPDVALDGVAEFDARASQIVHRLQIDPEFRAIAEKPAEPECGIRGHRSFPVNDGANAVRRDAQPRRQAVDG